jgi:hypothetical protein
MVVSPLVRRSLRAASVKRSIVHPYYGRKYHRSLSFEAQCFRLSIARNNGTGRPDTPRVLPRSLWTSYALGVATLYADCGAAVLVLSSGPRGPAAWWRTLDGDVIGRAPIGRA